ncbi:MAG: flagellar assembly protein FliW [Spirochaetes bacterium]|nr:flagellar assembly protein FliW [Spirochaetota bacterium]
MTIVTKPFGQIEVDERQIIDFPEGIYGFEDIKKFVILDANEKSPFKWLQAYSEPDLAFVIIRPVDFMVQYELDVLPQDLEDIGAKSPDEVLVFAIVTIPEDPSRMTANLQGPIIINPKTRCGKQAISLNDKYKVRHYILDEIKKAQVKG